MPQTIDPDVLEVLKSVAETCEGSQAVIGQQLSRPLYMRVNKVLEAIGGKWSRREKAHVFDGDAAILISDVVSTGEYIDSKKEFQFFETPRELVDRMLSLAEIERGLSLLEPSAGRGAIAIPARDLGASVECVELNEKMADDLWEKGFVVHCADFMSIGLPAVGILKEGGKPPRQIDERVDRVVMNPPFSRSQDIAHTLRAYDWLKPGGILVAILSLGWTFRGDSKAKFFRDWLRGHSVPDRPAPGFVEFETLPPNTFKASGTSVSTTLLKIKKPKES